jgi:FMN-dependent NADH-azoreductase
MNILFVQSSILGANSVTRDLSDSVMERLLLAYPDANVSYRDLAKTPIPHLAPAYLHALTNPDAPRSSETDYDLTLSAAVLAEFKSADLIVIGAPMYNFGLPSTLKAWIDRIAIAGETFRYTADGPVGLAGGKEVIIVSGRGSALSGTPAEAVDHQEAHLKTVLGFLGITDITVVRAEGVAGSPDHRKNAIADGRRQIAALRFANYAHLDEDVLI